MRIDPSQLRFKAGFLTGLSRSQVTFCGKRTSIQLQETAMVVEGELMQFHLLSLERYFARAVSEWSMITIPYGRLTRVKYHSKRVMRAFVWVILAVIFGLIGVGVWNNPRLDAPEYMGIIFAFVAPVSFIGWFVLSRLRPTYTVAYRLPDGAARKFTFHVRSKKVRAKFDAELKKYRDAADEHTRDSE